MPRLSKISLSRLFGLPRAKPTVVGTGLIALDVVIDADSKETARVWAGGTCANVLAILSYLGWNAYPIARLNGDAAARHVERDLRRWGVRLEFARLQPGGRTPIVVQHIRFDNSGNGVHRFSLRCPECAQWLPTYQPVPARVIQDVTSRVPHSRVVFLDRPSRGSLLLAEHFKEKGALVFFEPSGRGDAHLFRKAYALADIVKYSSEQWAWFGKRRADGVRAPVEIETMGAAGLRYRSTLLGPKQRQWTEVPAYNLPQVSDTAGAGDWCSAGILHVLGQHGRAGLRGLTIRRLARALRLGQALAAWTCSFEGARGGMYWMRRSAFRKAVMKIAQGARATQSNGATRKRASNVLVTICAACGSTWRKVHFALKGKRTR